MFLRWAFIAMATVVPLVAGVAPAAAQSVADFYRGKTVTMLVGTSPGGDYDLRVRMDHLNASSVFTQIDALWAQIEKVIGT